MSVTRSDSSRDIRKELMRGNEVPPIRNTIPICRYFHHAMNMYVKAEESMKENYTSRSYIYWKQFVTFVAERLPDHKQFKLNEEEIRVRREWCAKAFNHAADVLESIVAKLDREEDAVRAMTSDYDLIDEFDGDPCTEMPVLSQSRGSIPAPPIPPSVLSVKNDGGETSAFVDALAILREQSSPEEAAPIPNYPPLDTPVSAEFPSFSSEGHHSDRISHSLDGISVYDMEIFCQLRGVRGFFAPQPHRTLLSFPLMASGQQHFLKFLRHDFHVSFLTFLSGVSPTLRETRQAIESNRCFFIHVGMAFGIHPFALQMYFRRAATQRIADQKKGVVTRDDLEVEILQSCLQYSGFVDANCLMYIWPKEFHSARICLISGSANPIFTTFCSAEDGSNLDGLKDVIIHSDGSHFTLLKPAASEHSSHFSVLPYLLRTATAAGCVVQDIRVDLSKANTESVEVALNSLRNVS